LEDLSPDKDIRLPDGRFGPQCGKNATKLASVKHNAKHLNLCPYNWLRAWGQAHAYD
jgi:hypothetical protein